MKAISLHQPWAGMIARGEKLIETRTWRTSYSGNLLICSTLKPKIPGELHGYGLCIVELRVCIPMQKHHEQAACCAVYPGAYAWILDAMRPIKPFPVRGSQGFYEVADELIEVAYDG